MDTTLKAQDDAAAAVAVAPRVTLEHIESIIVAENYLNLGDAVCRAGQPDTAPMHLTTLCILTLRNGFLVTGTQRLRQPREL